MRHDALLPAAGASANGAASHTSDVTARAGSVSTMPAATSRSSAWPLPSDGLQRELAEIDRLRAQAQRPALAVGDRRERRDQLLELLRGLDDLLQVHGVVARDAAHALDRAREPEGRGERRAEVVTGVDDEVREIAGFSTHGRPRLMDARRCRERGTLRTGDRLAREHLGGVLAHALVGIAGARLGHERHELGGHVVPARAARAARRGGGADPGSAATRRRETSGFPAPGASPSSRSRSACGSGSRRISSASSICPHPADLGSSASHSPNGSSLTVASATAA